MIQVKLKQILLSQKTIANEGIIKITEQLNSVNQQKKDMYFNAKSLSKGSQETNLKLSLLILNNKFKDATIQESWIICVLGEQEQIDLSKYKGVFIITQTNELSRLQEIGKYVFHVRTLKQAIIIASLNQRQLDKRYKMQKMLRISQKKYIKNQNQLKMLNLSECLSHNSMKNQIRQFTKFLNFSGRCRLRMLRRFFTNWSIFHYQSKLSKIQGQIINQEFLIQHSNRKLKQKFFNAWKLIKLNFTRKQN